MPGALLTSLYANLVPAALPAFLSADSVSADWAVSPSSEDGSSAELIAVVFLEEAGQASHPVRIRA